MSEIFGFDAFSPKEIAARVETIGVAKARLPLLSMLMLSVLAGAFIGLGALYFVLVKADPALGFASKQVLGGVVFSLGLILVVVAGAELFTGNNLLAMAWADGKISTSELLRNWAIVCAGNFIGAAGLALLVFLSRHPEMNNGAIAEEYLRIAAARAPCRSGPPFQRRPLQCPGLYGGVDGACRTEASSTRRWQLSFPSPRSSPPASSTASPTCTSSRSPCCCGISETMAQRPMP